MKDGTEDRTTNGQAFTQDRVVHALREDTAQLLGYVLVEMAALREVERLDEVHAGLDELRDLVRVQLGEVLRLAAEISDHPGSA